MNPLQTIWLTALILAAGAILWMSGLIVLRMVHARTAARRLADRRQVEAALIGVIQGRQDADVALAAYRNRPGLLAETLLDFISIVRGEDRQLVVGVLQHLRTDRLLRGRIDRGPLPERLLAVEALGAFPGPEIQFALIRASRRGAPAVRLAALRSLWQAGGELTVGQLLAALKAGELPPSGSFAELLRLIVEADPAAALDALEDAGLATAGRVLVLRALGGAGAYAAIQSLTVHAAAPEIEVRTAAIEALGKLMHPAAQASLAQALDDPAWEVRSAAAEAIGGARLAGLAGVLAERLDDPVWRVRHQAAGALSKLGAAGAERLTQAASAEDPRVRRAAALALAGAV